MASLASHKHVGEQEKDLCSTTAASQLTSLTPNQIRHIVRKGLITPQRNARGAFRFSFQDIVVLRRIGILLTESSSMSKVLKHMRALKTRLGPEQVLSGVNLRTVGSHIVVQERNAIWVADDGQVLLNFESEPTDSHGVIEEFRPRNMLRDAIHADESVLTSDEWFLIGVELEKVDTEQAIQAYGHAIRIDEENTDAYINLGRLLQLDDKLEDAKLLYERALEIEPENELANFNLGTIFDTLHELDKAIRYYLRADKMESAHHNLSRIFELTGDELAARRHLNRARELQNSEPRG